MTFSFGLREQTRERLTEAMRHLANGAALRPRICGCQIWDLQPVQTGRAILQPCHVVMVLTERINRLSAAAGAEGGKQVLLWWESGGVCGGRSRLQTGLEEPGDCALLSARLQETLLLSKLKKTFRPQMGNVMTFIIIFLRHSINSTQLLCYANRPKQAQLSFWTWVSWRTIRSAPQRGR